MKHINISFITILFIALQVSAKEKSAPKCQLSYEKIKTNSGITRYHYDENSKLLSIGYQSVMAEGLPPVTDSAIYFYNKKGYAEKSVYLNMRKDTVAIELFDRSPGGKILQIHHLEKKMGDKQTREYSYDEFVYKGGKVFRKNNFKIISGKTVPEAYLLYFYSKAGNIDSTRKFEPQNDKLIITAVYEYDDKVNYSSNEVFSGDPMNDNRNNIISTSFKTGENKIVRNRRSNYEYNETGYPVKLIEVDSGKTVAEKSFEYRCK